MRNVHLFWLVVLCLCGVSRAGDSLPHSIWLEAETFGPLHGSNFSYQHEDQTTKGSWSVAGPDVAAAWTQGGESEWMSVAARADEPGEVTIARDAEIPAAGTYTLWVRYADYRGKKESFGVRITQPAREGGAGTKFSHVFGEKPVVDELDQMKLLWNWAFGWDHVAVDLKKGPAHIELYTTGPTEARRNVDCLCLTTDANYHPAGREKPDAAAWRVLRAMREAGLPDVTPLRAVTRDHTHGPADASSEWKLPDTWKAPPGPPAFLWNTGEHWFDELKKPRGQRMEWPFSIDDGIRKAFFAKYAGKEVPVYGDPASGPSIHIADYPAAFSAGSKVLDWFSLHPDRRFAILLNYGEPAWPKGTTPADRSATHDRLTKLGDRFVGFVAGENMAYESVDNEALHARIRAAKTRGEVLEALREAHGAGVVKKYSDYFGRPLSARDAWAHDIPCLSAGNEAFAHALCDWGVQRIGHENSGNSPALARRLAFLRGAARQFGAKVVDYQSCNLGDASNIFAREGQLYPASSRYIIDNQYDAWAGAGINWVLKDYVLFHVAGADAFYHEEGQDIYWKPGGNSAGDDFPVQLSPRGRVTEAFMKVAQSHPRGSQYTPIAFLLDEAHGWSQEFFQPGAFGLDPQLNPAVLMPNAHDASIRGWFDVAYFPAPLTQNEPASAIRQTYVNGIFGDIFDVIVTAPKRTQIAKTYPVLIAAGKVPLTSEWGDALEQYVENGGTLVVCDGQFTGPGAAALKLPAMGSAGEADAFRWISTGKDVPSNMFRYRALPADSKSVLAAAPDGKPIAVALERGRGRLIVIGVPLGLGIDRRPVPVLPLVLNGLTQGIMPVKVTGKIEWALNRLDDGGWLLTLLNNRGVIKPEHGVLPTNYHESQTVTVQTTFKVSKAAEWFTSEAIPWKGPDGSGAVRVTVPAGAVRMIELR